MTRVRLLVAMAGPDQAWSVGDWYHCDEAAAARMVAAGRAAYADPPVVAAVHGGGSERAMKPRPKGRG